MGMAKSLVAWMKKASRENRIWRTFWQAVFAYASVNLATWDGSQDLSLALETLAMGSIAAGLSALWKTSAANSAASQESQQCEAEGVEVKDGQAVIKCLEK